MNASSKSAVAWPKKIAFALLPALLLFGGLEGALRLSGFRYQPRQRVLYKPTVAELYGTMENYYPTVFDPPGYIWLRGDKIVAEDAEGNRTYAWPVEKKQGVKRVAFLGGSTTEFHQYTSYPERCVELLNELAGTNAYEGLNLGCSSYSSHQSLIALQRYALPRRPDVVVIYHGWNDPCFLEDGYSSKEKDGLLRAKKTDEQRTARWLAVRGLRVAQLLGRVLDRLDVGWPRPSVSPEDFRANLSRMIELCASNRIPVVLVARPISIKRLPWEDSGNDYDDKYKRHYGPLFGTNKIEIYQGMHKLYMPIQRELAAQSGGRVVLADAEAAIKALEAELDPPPEGVTVFLPDAMHLTAVGDQRLAETVAAAIAPDAAERIRAHTQSGRYWLQQARHLYEIDSPFECAYAARKALALDAALAPEGEPLVRAAEAQFEFRRLFLEGRWIGYPNGPFQEKMAKLQRCQQLRPSDYGLCLAIYRLCLYMDRGADAAYYLANFKPTTPRDAYQWLNLLLDSHAQGRRAPEIASVAEKILGLAPNDARARQFLEAVRPPRQAPR